MNNSHEPVAPDYEDNILSPQQRRCLQSVWAPIGLRARIQRRIVEMHSTTPIRHYALPRLAAAGLLGFLSFLGAQAVVGKVMPSKGFGVSNPSVETGGEVATAAEVANYHLQELALMSTSDLYLDTLGPVGNTPEVVLATYMHDHGAK